MATAGLTAAVLTGATAGLGVTLIVRELLPRQPQLASALDRLAPRRLVTSLPTATNTAGPAAPASASTS